MATIKKISLTQPELLHFSELAEQGHGIEINEKLVQFPAALLPTICEGAGIKIANRPWIVEMSDEMSDVEMTINTNDVVTIYATLEDGNAFEAQLNAHEAHAHLLAAIYDLHDGGGREFEFDVEDGFEADGSPISRKASMSLYDFVNSKATERDALNCLTLWAIKNGLGDVEESEEKNFKPAIEALLSLDFAVAA